MSTEMQNAPVVSSFRRYAEVAALLQKTTVTALVAVGYVIPMIVLWLMVFKPF